MILFKEAELLKEHITKQERKNAKIGYVPTMGALHAGHISLIKAARDKCDLIVCSIFINPAQFNDPKDFEKYPVTTGIDILLLERSGCDVLFLPPVSEIYPNGLNEFVTYDLGELENILEGKYRPGHFLGVCNVVHRLLQIVKPHYLFLGEKDYQQCLVVDRLINQLNLPVELVTISTKREPSGLAFSSRNARLTPEEKVKAAAIFEVLSNIKDQYNSRSPKELESLANEYLLKKGFAKVDYVSIADAKTLEPLSNLSNAKAKKAVALVAAVIGETRLIDNMVLTD